MLDLLMIAFGLSMDILARVSIESLKAIIKRSNKKIPPKK